MAELDLILLGPPGAGKGTQAALLTADFGLPHIATGDMLRAARTAGTDLGVLADRYMKDGQLVPDEVIIAMIVERLADPDAADGFLLDGFPRTIEQADALAAELEEHDRRLTAALLIEAPDELVVARISGRRSDPATGRIYHLEFDPPRGVDVATLVQRDDDREDTVRARLAVYHRQTEPLVEYYEQRGLLQRFDGTLTPEEVHGHIRSTLVTLRLEEDA